MRVVVTEFMSVDGIMEAPNEWTSDFFNEQVGRYKFEELFASEALLLGRVTYEGFADAWPDRTDEHGYADRINGLPKYVASTTMEKAEWNNSQVISDDLAEEVGKLKEQPGQNLLVFGSAELVNSLFEHDLVDEYRLMVFPVVVGHGKRLFKDGLDKKALKLAGTEAFDSGVTVLTYEPARD